MSRLNYHLSDLIAPPKNLFDSIIFFSFILVYSRLLHANHIITSATSPARQSIFPNFCNLLTKLVERAAKN